MPLTTGHGLAGLISACYFFKEDRLRPWGILLCVLAANIPDLDYIPGIVVGAPKRFHPSLTHSIFAAVLFYLMAYWVSKHFKAHGRLATAMGVAYTSHLFLDIIQVDSYTINGVGIPLFYPFTRRCFTIGWDWFSSATPLIDFSSFNSVLRSISDPELLRFLLHEQLVIGAVSGVILGALWVWSHKVVRPIRQKKY